MLILKEIKLAMPEMKLSISGLCSGEWCIIYHGRRVGVDKRGRKRIRVGAEEGHGPVSRAEALCRGLT